MSESRMEIAERLAAALSADRGGASRSYRARAWRGGESVRVYLRDSKGRDIGYVSIEADGSANTRAVTRGPGDVAAVCRSIEITVD